MTCKKFADCNIVQIVKDIRDAEYDTLREISYGRTTETIRERGVRLIEKSPCISSPDIVWAANQASIKKFVTEWIKGQNTTV